MQIVIWMKNVFLENVYLSAQGYLVLIKLNVEMVTAIPLNLYACQIWIVLLNRYVSWPNALNLLFMHASGLVVLPISIVFLDNA